MVSSITKYLLIILTVLLFTGCASRQNIVRTDISPLLPFSIHDELLLSWGWHGITYRDNDFSADELSVLYSVLKNIHVDESGVFDDHLNNRTVYLGVTGNIFDRSKP